VIAGARTRTRYLAIGVLVLLVLVAAVVIAAERHDRPPITAENLAISLTNEIGAGWIADATGDPGACESRSSDWICDVADPGGSTLARYTVRATSTSCWQASLTQYGERAPSTASGCVK
jgi:hypothetical protein